MGDTWDTIAELADREGLPLTFHAKHGWETHRILELSWRVRLPYHFLQENWERCEIDASY